MKRIFDFCCSFLGLLIVSPVLLPTMLIIWLYDKHSPFYIAPRVGRNGLIFNMVKLRSMVVNADKSGVDSTSNNDTRIIPIGRFIRRFKLDELTQLWNVLIGDMSLVGPRPNVKRGTDVYTDLERQLLTIRPGITDFASIVFSDEGELLSEEADPDAAYDRLIRPWKSRLGLLYIQHSSFWLDVRVILCTGLSIFSRKRALNALSKLIQRLNASPELVEVTARERPLKIVAPPGLP